MSQLSGSELAKLDENLQRAKYEQYIRANYCAKPRLSTD